MIPAYTPAQRLRIAIIGAVVPLLVAGVGIAIMLSWGDLPDPIAIHWGLSDAPDGFGPVAVTALLIGGVTAFFALVSTLIVIRLPAGSVNYVPRVLLATSVWLGVFVTPGIGGTVAMQRGLADAADAGSPAIPMLVGFAVALPLAALAWVLTPKAADVETPPVDAPTLALSADERVLFIRSARPAPFVVVIVLAAALLVIGAAIFAGAVGGRAVVPIIIAPAIIVLLSATSLFWHVRIDGAGFAARSLIGVPRFRYPLAQIAEARAVDLVPFREFGGWGIRFGSNGRVGVVLRSGEALEIERVDGRVFVITVDDATTAAGVLNGLATRMRNLSSDR